jgi:pimeloyl-ACP methyl ester carboxylesterase/DNA-binding CsgD family transcriptional regulator
MRNEENELIGMIYETALDPGLWPVVLDGLSELIEHPQKIGDHSEVGQRPVDPAFAGAQQQSAHELYMPVADSHQHLRYPLVDNHRLFDLLKPHLQQALRLRLKHQKVSYKLDMLGNILEKIPVGVLVVDRQLRVLVSNQMADHLLSKQTAIKLADDRLWITNESEHYFLRDKIYEVLGSTNEKHAIPVNLHKDQQNELSVLVSHLGYTEEIFSHSLSAALLLISPSLQQKTLAHNLLKNLYKFTQSECFLANKLIQNKTLEEIASERKVSINTIRNQVSSMFEKTNTHRQSELVVRLLSSPSISTPASDTVKSQSIENKPEANISHPRIDAQITLACGRQLGYAEYGDPAGKPVIFCHSVYGSRYEKPYDDNLLEKAGIRLIIPDRPGIGLSEPHVFSGYSGWCDDLQQLVEYLKLDSFGIFGYGTGGNFALAAAANFPGLVQNVTVISPTPPLPTLADLKPLLASHKIAMALAQKLPAVAAQIYAAIYAGAAKNPKRFLTHSLPADDAERELLNSPKVFQVYSRCLPELAKYGARGAGQEIVYVVTPWDFDLRNISQPVYFWRGELDKHAPQETSRKLFESIPHAKIRRLPNRGHAIFYTEWKDIVMHLLSI